MCTYRVTLISTFMHVKKMLDIKADTCLAAIKTAKHLAGPDYDLLESAYCVAA